MVAMTFTTLDENHLGLTNGTLHTVLVLMLVGFFL